MNQMPLPGVPPQSRTPGLVFNPKEFKIQALRECPTPVELQLCDTPDKAAHYWRTHIVQHPYFNPEVECMMVLLLNTRRRIKGHHMVATGTLDTLLVHPREVFRVAVISAASALVLAHNHPSGDALPSEADLKVTRDLIRAGQLLKIDVVDHVIMGTATPDAPRDYVSLRELGYITGA